MPAPLPPRRAVLLNGGGDPDRGRMPIRRHGCRIEDPPALAPRAAMPHAGVIGQKARAIAACLYTLR